MVGRHVSNPVRASSSSLPLGHRPAWPERAADLRRADATGFCGLDRRNLGGVRGAAGPAFVRRSRAAIRSGGRATCALAGGRPAGCRGAARRVPARPGLSASIPSRQVRAASAGDSSHCVRSPAGFRAGERHRDSRLARLSRPVGHGFANKAAGLLPGTSGARAQRRPRHSRSHRVRSAHAPQSPSSRSPRTRPRSSGFPSER
jgi:hypothetical protein